MCLFAAGILDVSPPAAQTAGAAVPQRAAMICGWDLHQNGAQSRELRFTFSFLFPQ